MPTTEEILRSPAVRLLSRVGPGVGAALEFTKNIRHHGIFESVTRTALSVGGGLLGRGFAAFAACPEEILTVVGIPACGLSVGVGYVGGSKGGEKLGVIFGGE